MGKGRKSEELVFWCQKIKMEETKREELAKEHLLPVIRDHRPTAELEKFSISELVDLYLNNVGEGGLSEITKQVKRAWYSRNSKEKKYFPVKLNNQQRKTLKLLYKSSVYGARSQSEVIARLIDEARIIEQQESELRKSLKRYHDRGDELARMRLGDKQQRKTERLEKQLDKSREKVTRLEAEMTTLKQLSSDLEAELLEVLVKNRLQDIVLAENNVDVSQFYQQIDNDKLNVDMLKEVRARLTAIKSKRSKLDAGYYIAGADIESAGGKAAEEQVGEDNETPEEASSDILASQDSLLDESKSNSGGVEQVGEPSLITKDLRGKAQENPEPNMGSESVEHCEPDSSSEQNSKPNKFQSGMRQMSNYIKWQKGPAKETPQDDNKK